VSSSNSHSDSEGLPVPLEQVNNFDPQNARSLFVVGDDAQSIYGFRGSQIEIILNFEKSYPLTSEIVLNQNYRSTQPILDLAEQVLTHNPHQKKKNLFTQNSQKTKVKYYLAKSEKDESEYIINTLIDVYQKNENQNSTKTETQKNNSKNEKHQKLVQIAKKILSKLDDLQN
jgi:superfamily I DNA/RNA helicase